MEMSWAIAGREVLRIELRFSTCVIAEFWWYRGTESPHNRDTVNSLIS